jgi:ATP-dependent Lhr-like helicase
MSLDSFHPAVATWFRRALGTPTPAQDAAWPAIASGRHALVAAPTGSGKTLAAFLHALDGLVRRGLAGDLRDETHVLYVSPLRALSHDVQKNLQAPLLGIRAELAASGLPDVDVRASVRTGDTPAKERAAMTRRPPHVLVTTPESLYILLTSAGGRRLLRPVRTVIVDEIHALADDRRGAHLGLTLERLEDLCEASPTRIGLSATQSPMTEVARFLVGTARTARDGTPDCAIVDLGHARRLDLGVEVPASPLAPVMSTEVWGEVEDRLADLVRSHRTTLIFVNTRRMSERLTRRLAERLGEEHVTAHHGSLSRDLRLGAEQRLKGGQLRALVATASLELGIDIGSVDLVCQVGSPRSVATLLQRVGRSGHAVGATPKGRLFPTSQDELVECVALIDAVRRGELDELSVPAGALDVLAQQVVAEVACGERSEDGLFAAFRCAWSYRGLERTSFDDVVAMLAEGFTTRRGRRSAWVFRDQVHGTLRPRPGARLAAITSGGAIPDLFDYDVLLEPSGIRIGSINEDFAIESYAGDIFQLGNASWRVVRVENGRVRVEDAKGAPPTIPFWLGEAPGRTDLASHAVSRLRADLEARLVADGAPATAAWLADALGLGRSAAEQVVEHLAAARAALGAVPTQDTLVLERFFDEAGGMQLVLHAPFGSRINRAWGLALRKRFCRAFNFELQAAATEDAIVLSLGPTHSFPLADVFHYLHSSSVRDVLVQAILLAPVFATRFRWNASRALAILRQRGGKRVPANLIRMASDDLMALVFPDQQACAENIVGDRQVPDHPLVAQAVTDCTDEAMDLGGLVRILQAIERGEKRLVAVDLPEPSPLCAEVLNARPYAFLDDAPLEERRTRAVASRRWLTPAEAGDVGALDASAIARVREEAWPRAVTPDDLHDALQVLGAVSETEGRRCGWTALLDTLVESGRATVARSGAAALWVAAERVPEVRAALPGVTLHPELALPTRLTGREWAPEEAMTELVRSRLEGVGPTTSSDVATTLGVAEPAIEAAMLALESEGFALRGRFTPGSTGVEWCDRRLLARIHQATMQRLRREIEPVTTQDFVRFLLRWHGIAPSAGREGAEALLAVIEQLEGFEAPAAAWEADILPARMARYDPAWLDGLCATGRMTWTRLSPPGSRAESARGLSPVRSTPIALVTRARLPAIGRFAPPAAAVSTSSEARSIHDALASRGALFFDELCAAAGLLPVRAEAALGELVAAGLVTSDSFRGLRGLVGPKPKRVPAHRRARVAALRAGVADAGRWNLTRRPVATDAGADDVETIAKLLLRRWGVVTRRLLERESALPEWRDLLRCYHRLEARGEIRGGRFVDSVVGEQVALPEAVTILRDVRRTPPDGQLVALGAADPLNLLGGILPGSRLPALAGNRLLLRDGAALACEEGGAVRFLQDVAPAFRWTAGQELTRRRGQPSSARALVVAASRERTTS